MAVTDRELVEIFHLHFVRLLATGPDKAKFIIKGGCNLRFFFSSPRYSEDVDIDVLQASPHSVKSRVDKLLQGPALSLLLRSTGIRITAFTAPKQTETTQRWKVGLAVEGRSVELRTKIEFSHRGTTGESKLDAVSPTLVAHHRTPPVLACHYLLPAAIDQKVAALAGRMQAQARDVFDLALLLGQSGPDAAAFSGSARTSKQAIARALELSYDDFQSQVAAYLPVEEAETYASPAMWEALQLRVVDALDRPS